MVLLNDIITKLIIWVIQRGQRIVQNEIKKVKRPVSCMLSGMKMYFLSYITRSIRYYVKQNDSYRPFIYLVVVKNALSSVNAERRPYLVEEKTLLRVSYYCQCCLYVVIYRSWHFTSRGPTTLHASC